MSPVWTTLPAPALPGTIAGVAAYFYDSEGVETTAVNGQSVTAAATLAQSVSVDEASAQRVWTAVGSRISRNRGPPGSRGRSRGVAAGTSRAIWTNAIDWATR